MKFSKLALTAVFGIGIFSNSAQAMMKNFSLANARFLVATVSTSVRNKAQQAMAFAKAQVPLALDALKNAASSAKNATLVRHPRITKSLAIGIPTVIAAGYICKKIAYKNAKNKGLALIAFKNKLEMVEKIAKEIMNTINQSECDIKKNNSNKIDGSLRLRQFLVSNNYPNFYFGRTLDNNILDETTISGVWYHFINTMIKYDETSNYDKKNVLQAYEMLTQELNALKKSIDNTFAF